MSKPNEPLGLSNSLSFPVVQFPPGTRTPYRRIVQGHSAHTLVEFLRTSSYSACKHPQWLILILFFRTDSEITITPPDGKPIKVILSGGYVFFLPPNWTYELKWKQDADVIVLYVEADQVQYSHPEIPLAQAKIPFSEFVAQEWNVSDCCLDLRSFAQTPNGRTDWRVASAGANLSAIIMEIYEKLLHLKTNPLPVGAAEIVGTAKAFIAANIRARILITAVAAHVHKSPRQLHRIFEQVTGRGLSRWIREYRCRLARDLLLSGENTKSVVEAVGFAGPSHMNIHLVRVYNTTAGGFAKAARMNAKRYVSMKAAAQDETSPASEPVRSVNNGADLKSFPKVPKRPGTKPT